jgi:hypothetical protein
MSRPTKIEKNCITGEETITELTDEEIADLAALHAAAEARQAQELAVTEAKAEAKASALAKLEALGLTEDEAKAIAG